MTMITKAVFPVAGLGTRFLPATKANPKEMLPIVDKPLIQYAVEEAVAVGITELIFVTNGAKRAIEDHFDSNFELESNLIARGKHELLNMVRAIVPEHVSCAYVRQKSPLGLGHAVLCAKQLIVNEPFAVLLADDLISAKPNSCLQQMLDIFTATRSSVIAVTAVPPAEVDRYGIVALAQDDNAASNKIAAIVEKPDTASTPSNLGVVGRYILTPGIFALLEATAYGAGGEMQLTDAIAKLLTIEEVYACRFAGKRFDCGSKIGYLAATIAYALEHDEVGSEFKQLLESVVNDQKKLCVDAAVTIF